MIRVESDRDGGLRRSGAARRGAPRRGAGGWSPCGSATSDDAIACCAQPSVVQHLRGWWPHRDERGQLHSHDPNRRWCLSCKREWFVPCPQCGWRAG
jgi:hypothetical protein